MFKIFSNKGKDICGPRRQTTTCGEICLGGKKLSYRPPNAKGFLQAARMFEGVRRQNNSGGAAMRRLVVMDAMGVVRGGRERVSALELGNREGVSSRDNPAGIAGILVGRGGAFCP